MADEGFGVTVDDLVAIIGELSIENRMLKKQNIMLKQAAEGLHDKDNGIQTSAWGVGKDERSQGPRSTMLGPTV